MNQTITKLFVCQEEFDSKYPYYVHIATVPDMLEGFRTLEEAHQHAHNLSAEFDNDSVVLIAIDDIGIGHVHSIYYLEERYVLAQEEL